MTHQFIEKLHAVFQVVLLQLPGPYEGRVLNSSKQDYSAFLVLSPPAREELL